MYYFIINPNSRSGHGYKVWNTVRTHLDELQIQYKFYFTKHKGHASELAAYLCRKFPGRKDIVILGGDGTINEVINGLTDFHNIFLGYIPSGSSNDFARSLHLPSDPLAALSIVLAPPKETVVDIGELEVINEKSEITAYHRFAVSSGIGFDATICYEAQKSKIKNLLNLIKLGKLTYGLIAAKQILTFQPMKGDIIVDGTCAKHYDDMLLSVQMVHPYEGGGAKMAPQANYQDKKISVCLIHNIPRCKVLLLLSTVFFGIHSRFKGVEIFDCSSLEITLAQPNVSHIDGEYAGTNQHIRTFCDRLSLTVSTPQ